LNKYFDSLISRFNKIADNDISFNHQIVIPKDEAIGIILSEKEDYNRELWKQIYKNGYPLNKYGESSRPVLVRYKDTTANPEVCSYNFKTKKFVFLDNDVTEFVKEWCEIPGYGYSE